MRSIRRKPLPGVFTPGSNKRNEAIRRTHLPLSSSAPIIKADSSPRTRNSDGALKQKPKRIFPLSKKLSKHRIFLPSSAPLPCETTLEAWVTRNETSGKQTTVPKRTSPLAHKNEGNLQVDNTDQETSDSRYRANGRDRELNLSCLIGKKVQTRPLEEEHLSASDKRIVQRLVRKLSLRAPQKDCLSPRPLQPIPVDGLEKVLHWQHRSFQQPFGTDRLPQTTPGSLLGSEHQRERYRIKKHSGGPPEAGNNDLETPMENGEWNRQDDVGAPVERAASVLARFRSLEEMATKVKLELEGLLDEFGVRRGRTVRTEEQMPGAAKKGSWRRGKQKWIKEKERNEDLNPKPSSNRAQGMVASNGRSTNNKRLLFDNRPQPVSASALNGQMNRSSDAFPWSSAPLPSSVDCARLSGWTESRRDVRAGGAKLNNIRVGPHMPAAGTMSRKSQSFWADSTFSSRALSFASLSSFTPPFFSPSPSPSSFSSYSSPSSSSPSFCAPKMGPTKTRWGNGKIGDGRPVYRRGGGVWTKSSDNLEAGGQRKFRLRRKEKKRNRTEETDLRGRDWASNPPKEGSDFVCGPDGTLRVGKVTHERTTNFLGPEGKPSKATETKLNYDNSQLNLHSQSVLSATPSDRPPNRQQQYQPRSHKPDSQPATGTASGKGSDKTVLSSESTVRKASEKPNVEILALVRLISALIMLLVGILARVVETFRWIVNWWDRKGAGGSHVRGCDDMTR